MKKLLESIRNSRGKKIFLQTYLMMTLVRSGLLLLPFSRLHNLVAKSKQLTFLALAPHEINIASIARAVYRSSRYQPGSPMCLARALTTAVLMNIYSLPHEINIGVAKGDSGKIDAHAWVISQGTVIVGDIPDLVSICCHVCTRRGIDYMSGIVGVYDRQGEPVLSEQLNSMVDTLAHRGLDGSKVWHQEDVGLGHLMLHTTPEWLIEELPYCDRLRDTAITADVRIDNRYELIDSLGLKEDRPDQLTDSLLILKAYHKWETNCTAKLIGDFVFAIWDRSKQRLFCARDHFGIKPFYYYATDSVFIFASEIKAILSCLQVPCKLDEAKIADFGCL